MKKLNKYHIIPNVDFKNSNIVDFLIHLPINPTDNGRAYFCHSLICEQK